MMGIPLDPELSDRYNDGVVPPPHLAGEPVRLPRPDWQPTAVQVQAARRELLRNSILLVLVILACVVVFALLSGWRP